MTPFGGGIVLRRTVFYGSIRKQIPPDNAFCMPLLWFYFERNYFEPLVFEATAH
jgi:hypothetical protein